MQATSAMRRILSRAAGDVARTGRRARFMRRAGVTLLELLVVILVMLMITALTIPVVVPALNGRQIREAARMVDVFISAAKTKAYQTGSPVGVVFEQDVPGGASTLSYAEVPPPYAGDQTTSTINVLPSGATFLNTGLATPNIFNQQDVGWYNMLRPGDLVQFNYRTTLYRVYSGEPYFDSNYNGQYDTGEPFTDTNGSGNYEGAPGAIQANGYFGGAAATSSIYNNGAIYFGALTYAYADPAQALQFMSPTGASGNYGPTGAVTFRILRQPVPLAAGKLQLSSAAAIDMGATIGTSTTDAVAVPGSGMDTIPGTLASFRQFPMSPLSSATTAPAPYTSRIVITFNPNGLVDLVYSWDEPTFTFNTATVGWQGRQPDGPIYLLIGRRELLGGDPEVLLRVQAGQAPLTPCFNYQDPTNLWVVINPFTGTITTAQNAAVDLTKAPPAQSAGNQSQLQFFYSGLDPNPSNFHEGVYQARSIAREMQAMGGR